MAVTIELFKDACGEFRFHLRAGNGEVIATSGGYESEASARNAIEAAGHSPTAVLVGHTA